MGGRRPTWSLAELAGALLAALPAAAGAAPLLVDATGCVPDDYPSVPCRTLTLDAPLNGCPDIARLRLSRSSCPGVSAGTPIAPRCQTTESFGFLVPPGDTFAYAAKQPLMDDLDPRTVRAIRNLPMCRQPF